MKKFILAANTGLLALTIIFSPLLFAEATNTMAAVAEKTSQPESKQSNTPTKKAVISTEKQSPSSSPEAVNQTTQVTLATNDTPSQTNNTETGQPLLTEEQASPENPPSHQAKNIDLKEVIDAPAAVLFPSSPDDISDDLVEDNSNSAEMANGPKVVLSAEAKATTPNYVRHLLDVDIPPGTTTRVNWSPSRSFAGIAVDTPVLVVNGAMDGPTLCLTAAVHGDELNGIEMVRRILYNLDPNQLHGMVVGVPIVNLLGFSRNSRYLPDRRDLNRYFPGNPTGSVAARLAHTFFNDVVKHCNALVDLHTGSFYRTNITQLRANLNVPAVAEFAELFGDIPVLNTVGNHNSLRAAAVRAGIPTVTLEAGEPMRMQTEVVEEGVIAIKTLLEKNGMYPSFSLWAKPSPAFYRSAWLRANASGILFSSVALGENVKKGDILGQVINPISNEKTPIISRYQGRVLGMALDQFVLPGFAAYHIGIRERDAKKLIETPTTIINGQLDTEEPNDHDSDSLDNINKPEKNGVITNIDEGFDD
ncbi:succinylglutamate desuccinylase/aspartoacylase family protein [Oceanicoccus sp. KOV_DT_Chl]|uniref:M14 family metallopeptidase n=1 Tax=Oceanicoccus sp. KOV_DT_Chl TaxID=1904639 RepID=UPI001F1D3C23|nr:succinylglutamate desuccinylase/aspartoacylase family protein [Oceanicoccus sp. KOV_DT_Chl]